MAAIRGCPESRLRPSVAVQKSASLRPASSLCGPLNQSHTRSIGLPVSFRFRSSKRGSEKCYELRNRDTWPVASLSGRHAIFKEPPLAIAKYAGVRWANAADGNFFYRDGRLGVDAFGLRPRRQPVAGAAAGFHARQTFRSATDRATARYPAHGARKPGPGLCRPIQSAKRAGFRAAPRASRARLDGLRQGGADI